VIAKPPSRFQRRGLTPVEDSYDHRFPSFVERLFEFPESGDAVPRSIRDRAV